jgi:hypothetical protein
MARPASGGRATRDGCGQDILVTETVGMTGLSVRLIFMRRRPPFDSHDPPTTQEGFTQR